MTSLWRFLAETNMVRWSRLTLQRWNTCLWTWYTWKEPGMIFIMVLLITWPENGHEETCLPLSDILQTVRPVFYKILQSRRTNNKELFKGNLSNMTTKIYAGYWIGSRIRQKKRKHCWDRRYDLNGICELDTGHALILISYLDNWIVLMRKHRGNRKWNFLGCWGIMPAICF